jgi:hypothetical protein
MFLTGFNQKTPKEDLFIKGNHVNLRWYLRGKTLEDSKYEKVRATVYLIPSDTKVLEIYLLKNTKMLHDEFLYNKA